MAKQGKRYKAARSKIDRAKLYPVNDIFELLASLPAAKFDETIVATVVLGVDPAKNDQMVRGGVVLPKGLGKARKVIVFAKGEKVQEAQKAGADAVGLDELVEKILEGWLDFDVAIATPDVMGGVAKVAKILGPRGLMPNPKTDTVTFDVTRAVREAKAGKVDFRLDKGANLHVPIGKRSFAPAELKVNFEALMEAVVRAKPNSAKGIYLQKIFVSPTMGPSIPVDPAAYRQ